MLIKKTRKNFSCGTLLCFFNHEFFTQDLFEHGNGEVALEHTINGNGYAAGFFRNDDGYCVGNLACADSRAVAHAKILA